MVSGMTMVTAMRSLGIPLMLARWLTWEGLQLPAYGRGFPSTVMPAVVRLEYDLKHRSNTCINQYGVCYWL